MFACTCASERKIVDDRGLTGYEGNLNIRGAWNKREVKRMESKRGIKRNKRESGMACWKMERVKESYETRARRITLFIFYIACRCKWGWNETLYHLKYFNVSRAG